MSPAIFIIRSLRYHWRIHLAVGLGVAAATAVLIGALLVGDSMRGSLQHLTLDRLGKIDEVVVSDQFFREDLADELSEDDTFAQYFDSALGIILLQGSAEQSASTTNPRQAVRRARGVTVLGIDEAFWELGGDLRVVQLGRDQVVINQPLADQLNVRVGDLIVLRLPNATQVPGDSTFAHKNGTVSSLPRLRVVSVIPARSLGRFSLASSQQYPWNVYVATSTLQEALEQPGRINSLLVAGRPSARSSSEEASRALMVALRPTLADYGFSLQRVRQSFTNRTTGGEETVFDYYNLTTDRMMLSPAVDAAAENALMVDHAQPVLTYLANSIGKGPTPGRTLAGHLLTIQSFMQPAMSVAWDGEVERLTHVDVPYSTITAIDSTASLGALLSDGGTPVKHLQDGDIVLNSWAAADLKARPGDTIQVTYFAPETAHGVTRERTEKFKLRAIVPLTEPAEPYRANHPAEFVDLPTPANDPYWTPTVKGLTDRESIANWDAPFPYDSRRIREQDEVYWDNHRTTPKAFVSLTTGRRLWGTTRFGKTTSYRIPAGKDVTPDGLARKLLDQLNRDGMRPGFHFLAVKRQGLAASWGTTSFSGLFLGFSFFIIAAAVMLVALLFRLGIEQRAGELGILATTGLRPQQIGRWLATEGLLVSIVGGLVGIAVGIGYARLMLLLLSTWWLEAVVTPFLQLHVTATSLVAGLISGVVVAVLTILWSLRQFRGVAVRQLLSGRAVSTSNPGHKSRRWTVLCSVSLLILAFSLSGLATQLAGEAQAGSFFGSGAAVLIAGLMWIWHRLSSGHLKAAAGFGHLAITRLALRNAGRNPLRSTLTIGLVASAGFLIVAISAFRVDPTRSGAGGFALVAESELPIYYDLDTEQGRREIGLVGDDAKLLASSKMISLRVQPGDDASCLNLYQPRQPRVLGIPESLPEYFSTHPESPRFAWSESAADTPEEKANPWLLLEKRFDDGAVPVILDKNTAMYSMHLFMMKGTGTTFQIEHEDGRTIRYRIVGLLSNSIFQGNLLIGESYFTDLFPEGRGYRYFLIKAEPIDTVLATLEDRLSDEGFDAQTTHDKLRDLLAVQNTYLTTFQSLGALGLLLGTFGLATVQVRNILERRGELALLRATGFRRSRLARLVLVENAVLLLGGMVTGVAAALVAILPHVLAGGAAVPWPSLAVLLGTVIVIGILAGLAAVRAMLCAPLVAALRGD